MDVQGTAVGPSLLALSASAVAFGYLYLRRRYTIDPAGEARLVLLMLSCQITDPSPPCLPSGCVCWQGRRSQLPACSPTRTLPRSLPKTLAAAYRLAMYRLNTHPGLLEVSFRAAGSSACSAGRALADGRQSLGVLKLPAFRWRAGADGTRSLAEQMAAATRSSHQALAPGSAAPFATEPAVLECNTPPPPPQPPQPTVPPSQVMGAPLAGSPVQASVLTGGGIRFRGLRPRVQSKRLQMICERACFRASSVGCVACAPCCATS